MSFDYDHLRKKADEGHTNWWTSYADLFMMMSVVFLLMYVTASLRSGAAGYQQQVQFEKLKQENVDLIEQIKVYNTLKDQQLTQTTEAEQQVYARLIDKLKLLQEESREEKESLQSQARENAEKELALNQYQQMIRNIVNANILAKAQIKRREQIIDVKTQTLSEKEKQISVQETDIKRKEILIAQNQAQISQINQELEQQIANLKREQKRSRITHKEAEKRIAKLRRESGAQIEALNTKSVTAEKELEQVRGSLVSTEAKLGATQKELVASRDNYLSEIGHLKAKHDSQLKAERESFQQGLEKQNLSAAARAKKLADFAAENERKARALEGQIAGLNSKVRDTNARLAGAEQEKGRYIAAVEGLKKEKEVIQGDLDRARTLANARKSMAAAIMSGFHKAGVKADVDSRTGDVTLDFGEEYFDTGSAALKPAMRDKLEQFFPAYTEGLFNNPKFADKIANVEIVGFASSTYRGKYVNPQSLKAEDRAAVNYNLKLSFARANEIFKNIYSNKTLTEEQKQKLLPMLKVVGRGYLPEGKKASDFRNGMPEAEFCKKYNCKKAQRVIVKFNLKD